MSKALDCLADMPNWERGWLGLLVVTALGLLAIEFVRWLWPR